MYVMPTAVAPAAATPAPSVANVVGDRDGDGIPDESDRCVDAPEDCDRYEDEDGCPDVDNDNDRIVDLCDACANEPETYNGINDEDGCPDRSDDDMVNPIYQWGDALEVRFDARGRIDVLSDLRLARFVAMRPFAEGVERIEVVGQSAVAEPDAVARSLRRAESVRASLLAHGLGGIALGVHGVGEATLRNNDHTAPPDQRAFVYIARVRGDDLWSWDGSTIAWVAPPPHHASAAPSPHAECATDPLSVPRPPPHACTQ